MLKGLKHIVGQSLRNLRGGADFKLKTRNANPILIYQMGKVGSKSIHAALLKQYKGIVGHTHSLSRNHRRLDIRLIYKWAVLDKKPLNIISLTREPISRNVSAFFQNFERDTGVAYKEADLSTAELKETFLTNYRHEVPLFWFDWRVKELFDIDVFAHPFPKEEGIGRYQKNNIRLLVMHSEISDAKKERAIGDFLGINGFRLSKKENIGAKKAYQTTYKDFKSNILLPADYVEWMCDSKYFNHFYTSETIESVRKRWNEAEA